jgi:hypothetical protein
MDRKIVWVPAVLFLFTLSLALNSGASASEQGAPQSSDPGGTLSSPVAGQPGQHDTRSTRQSRVVPEPERDFQAARQSLLRKDAKAAAAEIREGAAFLAGEAGRATGKGKQALMASVHELERLASEVEKGSVRSAKELEGAFARAHHALAQRHPKSARVLRPLAQKPSAPAS